MQTPPPSYVTLEPTATIRAPPYQNYHNIPQYGRPKKSKGYRCLKCICFCYCILFLLMLIVAGLSLYFYTIYKPHLPTYNIKSMDIKTFEAQQDFSLKTEFIINIEANNPNSHITSLMYGKESNVVVRYKDSSLCSGKLPAFRQGHNNVTLMQVHLIGKSEFGSDLQEALNENRKNSRVPLLVNVKVPLHVEVGKFRLRQFVVNVNCCLVLDSLSADKKPKIISSKYDVHATW